ncbi:MAG: radical SAM protein [Candidatus Thermoplasmatota archaeon]
MSEIEKLLRKYTRINNENGIPNYVLSSYKKAQFDEEKSLDYLWKIHSRAKDINPQELKPDSSILDLKKEIASRVYERCKFCENKCNVNRKGCIGKCKVKEAHIASEFLHFGEESFLVPSYTVFFSGCTFKCVFCQNWDISQRIKGLYIKPEQMAEFIKKNYHKGAKNVNWVGGDPTPNIPYILDVLDLCDVYLPHIWNSNMYCSKKAMFLLEGIIDLYLTDFKYGNNECAKRYSKVNRYMEVVTRNHKFAYKNGDLLIRHLVLPNHLECCTKPILEWISKNVPNAVVNIMGQYHAEYRANEYKEISRRIYPREIKDAMEYAKDLDLYLI